tara:strand:- start:4604 stop:5584 length:981 start_codon:yes stop_codon:yes gene_type:complete
MPCEIKNNANIDLSSLEPHIQGMYDYFDQKIGFNKPPTMVFGSDPENQANVLGKTAYYDPSNLEIFVYSDGRHPKDMLRSIAHELIHHKQNLDGRLSVDGYHGEGYYLKNKKLKKLEQEAMKYGNELMREYEDNLKLKERNEMSLKEWKNNELSGLLMKRFGILKEEKGVDDNTGLMPASKEKGKEGGNWEPEGKDKTYDSHMKDEKDEVNEDSGEEEKRHYEDNAWSDEDHIEAIEKHLKALKKDKDYDEDHEELEETVSGRKDNERNRRNDDPRLREENDGLGEPGNGAPEDAMLPDSVKESKNLKESMQRVLKKNKKLRLRFK